MNTTPITTFNTGPTIIDGWIPRGRDLDLVKATGTASLCLEEVQRRVELLDREPGPGAKRSHKLGVRIQLDTVRRYVQTLLTDPLLFPISKGGAS